MTAEKLLTYKDAAKRLGCSTSAVYGHAAKLGIPLSKVGNAYLVRESDLEKLKGSIGNGWGGRRTRKLPARLALKNTKARLEKLQNARPTLNSILASLAKVEKMLTTQVAQLEKEQETAQQE